MMVSTIEQELDILAVAILPENFKYLRENYLDPESGKLGLTQEQLAQRIGVSVHTVKKYESHKDPMIPSSMVLAKMCKLYRTELYFSPDPDKEHPALKELE